MSVTALLLILLYTLVVASENTGTGPHVYAEQYAQFHQHRQEEAQREADNNLDFFFYNHIIAPHGTTLVAMGDVVMQESILAEIVRRKVAMGWNASLARVNVTGDCLMNGEKQVRALCRSSHVLGEDKNAALIGKKDRFNYENGALVYPCERAPTWFWQSPRCRGNVTVTVIRITLPALSAAEEEEHINERGGGGCADLMEAIEWRKRIDREGYHHTIYIGPTPSEETAEEKEDEVTRYQKKALLVQAKRESSARRESDGFLARLLSSHRMQPGRNTILSLYRWPSTMQHIAQSVAALGACGWSATLTRLKVTGRRRGDGFPGHVCIAQSNNATDGASAPPLLLSYVQNQYRHVGWSGNTAWSKAIQDQYYEELLYDCGANGNADRVIDVVFIGAAA
jgi:hypothetical protein